MVFLSLNLTLKHHKVFSCQILVVKSNFTTKPIVKPYNFFQSISIVMHSYFCKQNGDQDRTLCDFILIMDNRLFDHQQMVQKSKYFHFFVIKVMVQSFLITDQLLYHFWVRNGKYINESFNWLCWKNQRNLKLQPKNDGIR